MKYLLVLPLFGLLALLPACGGGRCKTSSCQTSCCETQHCQAPAVTEAAPEAAPVTVVEEEAAQETKAPATAIKEELDDEDLEEVDEIK